MAANGHGAAAAAADDDEDDYMNMVLPGTGTGFGASETSLQRRERLKRESEAKARPLSKKDQALKEAAEREKALATSLDSSNKGFKMMAKLGFTGGALGKKGNQGRVEPIAVDFREGRGGIGLDSDRKRKLRAEIGDAKQQQTEDEGDYRKRVRREREEQRLEGQILGAQRVAERLDEEKDAAGDPEPEPGRPRPKPRPKPLKSVNVLYRGRLRAERDRERDVLARRRLEQSLSSVSRLARLAEVGELGGEADLRPGLPAYDDGSDADSSDGYDSEAGGPPGLRKLGAGRETDRPALNAAVEETEEEGGDAEDAELDAFEAQSPADRLAALVSYLRAAHWWCLWCKQRYESAAMEGCPGLTEEEHD